MSVPHNLYNVNVKQEIKRTKVRFYTYGHECERACLCLQKKDEYNLAFLRTIAAYFN